MSEHNLPPPPSPADLPPGPPPGPSTPTNTLAIVSLVSGILGVTLLPWLGSLAAVITGHMARAEIRRNPAQDGDVMAVIGLVLGWLMLVLSILGILAIIVAIVMLGGLAAVLAAAGLSGQL